MTESVANPVAVEKLESEVPSTNIKAPENYETPTSKHASLMLLYWSLVVGPSLDVGTWNLVLKRIVGCPLVIRFASRQFTSADRS
jgi:hypothetical protein